MRRLGGLVLAALAVLAIAACNVIPGQSPVVHLQNETETPVAIHVNDTWIGTYPGGADIAIPIPTQGGTYDIQARSPSGKVLVSIVGTAAMVEAALRGEQVLDAWEDHRCGRITLSVGHPTDLDRPPANPPVGTCP